MKRKYILCLTVGLCASYMYVCIILFFGLDIGDKKPATWVKSVAHKVQDKWQKDGLNELLKPRCVCDYWAPPHDENKPGVKLPDTHEVHPGDGMCMVTEGHAARHKADIQMLSLYEVMKISYPKFVWTHTGWNQNYDLTYSGNEWNNNPLTVFIVPFSHIDPGWLATEEEDYLRAKKILNLAVDWLTGDKTLTFVWAEVIYLARWYESATPEAQTKLKSLLREGRFEIVNGGWVMPDEASTHVYALHDQMLEGHHWLDVNLNYTVQSAWNIDSFGASGGAVPYLLRRAGGIKNLVVQRAHYAVQQHLAGNKQLEFHWEQTWERPHKSELFTHLSPYLSYNILYTCGPDIQACCHFDFYRKKCWKYGEFQEPEAITKLNVADKANLLLDQWRKTSTLYKHHFLLMPHGDNFRYETATEWEKQISNLKKVMDYMNSHEEMRVQVKFGTLKQYFDAVHSHATEDREMPVTFPSLSGDFFPYSDRSDQYWSGFYTSRAFLKSMVRILQSQLRACEILFTFSLQYGKQKGGAGYLEMFQPAFRHIVKARQVSALLQHHNAITGTAKAKVVTDYLEKSQSALAGLREVLSITTSALLQVHHSVEPYDVAKPLEDQPDPWQYPQLSLIPASTAEENTLVVVFNPLASDRVDTVTVMTGQWRLMVQDDHTRIPVPCQIDPVFTDPAQTRISSNQFQLMFVVHLSALSITRFRIVPLKPEDEQQKDACQLAWVKIYSKQHQHNMTSVFPLEWRPYSTFSIRNHQLEASFCHCNGLLQGVTTRTEQTEHNVRMHLMTYGTGHWAQPYKDLSGAHIFSPDGEAQDVECEHPVVIVSAGPVLQSAATILPSVTQTVTLYNVNGTKASGLWIENSVDLRTSRNTEMSMRIVTELKANSARGEAEFYTDSNAFQMMRRRTLSKLPMQGNFYPVSSLLYIEDTKHRISLHTAQAHGAASLYPGQLEVILDRTLAQDDWRGLGEGVEDNVPVVSRFVLTIESFTNQAPLKPEQAIGFPSTLSHRITNLLEQPPITQLLVPHPSARLTFTPFSPLLQSSVTSGLPCDVHLHGLRTLVGKEGLHGYLDTLLMLRRPGLDCRLTQLETGEEGCLMSKNGQVHWQELFAHLKIRSMTETTITGLHPVKNITDATLHIPAMELKTYNLQTIVT